MSPGQDALRRAIVAEARSWIGTPYVHGASLKGAGCDCLGLVRGVWRALHGDEPEPTPPYSPDWAEATGRDVLTLAAERHLDRVPLERAEPGDVLLFRWRAGAPAKHLGVSTGGGRMIHAHDGARVCEVAIGVWTRRLCAAFRFPARRTPLDEGRLDP
ncbi:NlpC/P60 family protein [Alsobacter sp. SYSU BS001988]